MLIQTDKKIFTILCSNILFIWIYVQRIVGYIILIFYTNMLSCIAVWMAASMISPSAAADSGTGTAISKPDCNPRLNVASGREQKYM